MADEQPSAVASGGPAAAIRCDVAVLGGGLAGLAAAIKLRRAGMRVVCVEPDAFPHDRVGESLDWSAPSLLAELGLPGERLLGSGVATSKQKITVVVPGCEPSISEPPEWWCKPPLRFEDVTLHVDRVGMDSQLYALAVELGVELVWERAREVFVEGERVTAVATASGQRIEATWFVDSSGRGAHLFERKFAIGRREYGREKVSLWCYFETPCQVAGTTFYIDDPQREYLRWIWEIPITPTRTSVGVVMEADDVRRQRRAGQTTGDVLRNLLAPFPRFAPLLAERGELAVRATAYRCFVLANACGPNWLIAGEAAALPDALTGNGVTAALRHASEGAELILEARERGSLSARQRRIYNANVQRLGHMFNHAMEAAVYQPPIRRGFGFVAAQVIYIMCAFILNALYSRARPKKWLSMLTFGVLMRVAWLWIEGCTLVAKVAVAGRGLRRAAPPGVAPATS